MCVGAKISYKDNGVPISVFRIVKYCGVWGGGGIPCAKILQKIMPPPLSGIKIIKYCGQKYIAYKHIIVNCLSPTDPTLVSHKQFL